MYVTHESRLLRTEELADLLGIAPRTVREWAEGGKLPGFKLGKQWRFRQIRIQQWLDHRANTSNLLATTE